MVSPCPPELTVALQSTTFFAGVSFSASGAGTILESLHSFNSLFRELISLVYFIELFCQKRAYTNIPSNKKNKI